MTVTVELTVNGSADPVGRYLTWTPYPAQLRLVAPDTATGPVTVLLRNAATNVGRLAFRSDPTEDGESETTLELPVDGSPVDVLLSGEFMAPSVEDGDAVLEAVVDGEVVAQVPFMVRVRKDAESLTDAERDRFVSAFAWLNNRGLGVFRGFHAMHTEDTNDEAHGLDAFLPWHRAYLLDLERELQVIDPSVALPYWRFDAPAPRLFSPDFVGAPAGAPSAGRSAARAVGRQPAAVLDHRRRPGVDRHPRFADPRTGPASPQRGGPCSTSARCCCSPPRRISPTVRGRPGPAPGFRDILEGNPHGAAHVSFAGYIRRPARPPVTRCSSFSTATSTGSGRSGSGTRSGSTRGGRGVLLPGSLRRRRADPDRPQPARHDVAVERRDRRRPAGHRTPAAVLASRVVAGPATTPTVGDLVDFQGHATGRPPAASTTTTCRSRGGRQP